MEDVASAAGVAKGTIYLYFPSKEHILLALKRQFMNGLVDELTDVIAGAIERLSAGEPVDYRDIIDRIFESIVTYHREQREALEVVVRQSPGPDLIKETLELEKDFVSLLASAFHAGNEYGIIQTADPDMTARLVNTAVRDNLCTCLLYQDPADLDRLLRATKDVLYKALAPDIDLPPRKPRLVRS
jgi:TetR/AcrR family fatty acid metabolism transcriptional regulator